MPISFSMIVLGRQLVITGADGVPSKVRGIASGREFLQQRTVIRETLP
jgi:hypothetical protein